MPALPIRRRETSLLFAAVLLSACGDVSSREPPLPASVSPGWTRTSLAKSSPPPGLAPAGDPQCWQAKYAGRGDAEVWACGYRDSTFVLDAVQRARAEAQTVRFGQGGWYVEVKWNNAAKADRTTLIRNIQKRMQPQS